MSETNQRDCYNFFMKNITLHASWQIKAPAKKIFQIITDFEQWPAYFPKVAESIEVLTQEGHDLEIKAMVKSFGRTFPVYMKVRILPEKGFTSDNESPTFGTSGHEEFMLSEFSEGTMIDYTYQVVIHKLWLRLLARPLIGWYAMRFWQNAVIDVLKQRLED